MSTFLQYTESSETTPDGSILEFIFNAPSGYSPVDNGNVLWLISGTKVDESDYTVTYGDSDITLTLVSTYTPPEVTDTFAVFADSETEASDYTVDNFTNYSAARFKASYPQVANFPAITDNIINERIVRASQFCNETKFGVYYNSAMGLLVAHIFTLEIDAGIFTTANGNGSGGFGTTISMGTSGAINSAGAGSVNYSANIEASKSSTDEWLKSTGWGQQFLAMRNMIIAPGITVSRGGVGFGISR